MKDNCNITNIFQSTSIKKRNLKKTNKPTLQIEKVNCTVTIERFIVWPPIHS